MQRTDYGSDKAYRTIPPLSIWGKKRIELVGVRVTSIKRLRKNQGREASGDPMLLRNLQLGGGRRRTPDRPYIGAGVKRRQRGSAKNFSLQLEGEKNSERE